MLLGGAIGGGLFNMHCLAKHVGRDDFLPKYLLSYYISPLSGAVCGLIVVVLFLGGVLTLGLGEEAGRMALLHPGRLMRSWRPSSGLGLGPTWTPLMAWTWIPYRTA